MLLCNVTKSWSLALYLKNHQIIFRAGQGTVQYCAPDNSIVKNWSSKCITMTTSFSRCKPNRTRGISSGGGGGVQSKNALEIQPTCVNFRQHSNRTTVPQQQIQKLIQQMVDTINIKTLICQKQNRVRRTPSYAKHSICNFCLQACYSSAAVI